MNGNAKTKIMMSDSVFNENQIMIVSLFAQATQALLPIFAVHVASDPFNLTSFAVLSDAGGGVIRLR